MTVIPGKPWYDDDRFWDALAPALFGMSRIAMASEEVEAIIALTGLAPPACVLDMACGVGRHSIEFARRGFSVTGVDRTASYIERARRRAADEGLEVEFVLADMREFVRDGAFDLALCLYTSLGYFDERADDRKAIENVSRSLRHGGAFVVDTMAREILPRVFHPRNWHDEDGVILLEESSASGDWSRVDNRWIIIDGDERAEVEFSLHVYSAVELEQMLEGCGLGITGTCGWFDGSPFDGNALRLVITSRRP